MSGKRAQQPFLTVTRALLLLWASGSCIWVGYWARYFYDYCDFGLVSSCVAPQGLWAASYSLGDVFELVLGVPGLILLAGLAIGWGRAMLARTGANLR